MRYAATYNQDGKLISPTLHMPKNLSDYAFVPHPLQLTGAVAPMTTYDARSVGGFGLLEKMLRRANPGTSVRQKAYY